MGYQIKVSDSDDQFSCSDAESVLEGMHRTGHKGIPCGCRGGACGVCKVEILTGEYASKRMSSCHVNAEDLAARRVLACRIVPQSDIELRVIGKMKVVFGKCLSEKTD